MTISLYEDLPAPREDLDVITHPTVITPSVQFDISDIKTLFYEWGPLIEQPWTGVGGGTCPGVGDDRPDTGMLYPRG